MAVTPEDVQEELTLRQLQMTNRMLLAIMSKVAALQPCFDSHGYTDDDVFLITVYLCSLIATVNGADGRIKSQSAPSGASRSFDYQKIGDRWKALRDLLRGVDPHGCTDELVPPNPEKKGNAALWISPGVSA